MPAAHAASGTDHGAQATTQPRRPRSGRRIAGLGLGALLAVGLVGPVSAAQPDIVWIGEETLLFEGYCPFPVLLEDDHSSAKELSFPPNRAGYLLTISSGAFRSTLTNLDSGATVEGVVTGGRVKFLMDADTLTADFSGTTLLWYTAEDAAVSQLGQGLFVGNGRGFESYDRDGLVQAVFEGQLTDLCELLAD